MDGIIAINKTAGMTSHDVVARVRRILSNRRAGHAGTLDPDATGVLVVAVGQATRILPFLPTEPKVYVARAVFGVATDTEDASGTVTARMAASHLTQDDIAAVLPRFVGEIAQVPPMVSAVHHQGRRLYELAREGKVVERAARTVQIHSLTLTDFAFGADSEQERPVRGVETTNPLCPTAEATLIVSCGGGTYIRTLCKDIGEALGLPAHMKTLVRTAVGPFRREASVSLDELRPEHLVPMADALHLPTASVSEAQAERLDRGMAVSVPLTAISQKERAAVGIPETLVLLYQERLKALARFNDGQYKPFKVFPSGNVADKEDDE